MLRAFQLSFAVLAAFSLAAGIGASVVAKDLVLVLLGPNWVAAIPFVQLLAIHAAFWSLVESMQPYFIVTHREKLFALCTGGYVAILIPAIIIVAHTATVEAVALTRAATTILFSVGMLSLLVAIGAFSVRTLTGFIWRPLVAAIAMGLCVGLMDFSGPPIIVLAARVTIGLLIFPSALFVLWCLAGRPSGPELRRCCGF